jgi:hypothetical protein
MNTMKENRHAYWQKDQESRKTQCKRVETDHQDQSQ